MNLEKIMDVISTKYLLVISAVSMLFIGINATGDDVSFVFLDSDSSGFITYNEARANHLLQLTFNDSDLNRDGVISAGEFNYATIE
jgi:Ca2+-binding EF-hand superfamily protein